MTTENDTILFDRLVDGELPERERQQLLASLDDREDGWRRCALAFLEAQSWGKQFSSLMDESEKKTPIARAAHDVSTPKSYLLPWFAAAACLLIAFFLGRAIRQENRTDPQVVQVVESTPQEEVNAEEPEVRDLPDREAITLLVKDSQGRNQRVQVPLMDVVTLDKEFGQRLPANLRDRIRSNGFDLERRRRYAPMFFEQDEQIVPMVVPVDDTYIVPVSRPIY